MAARERRGWATRACGSVVLLVGLTALAATAQAPPSGPLPVPSRVRLEAAVEAVREQYKDDYATADGPKGKRTLARKLVEGASSQPTPERIYAALDEARRLAAEAGDPTIALSVLAEMNTRFQFRDGAFVNLLLETLEPIVASPGLTARDAKRIASLALATSLVTLERKDYERTARLGKVAAAAAAKTDDEDLKREADALQRLSADLQAASKKLATEPDDPEANDALGIFWALVRGHWDTGLPYLAKSSQAGVREAADQDLQNPTSAKGRTAVGDLWYKLGEGNKGALRQRYWERAWEWYSAALAVESDPDSRAGMQAKRLEQASPGEFFRELKGHTDEVNGVAFSPDGRTLASASYDNTVRLWDPISGREIRSIEHDGLVWDVTFSPDSRTLLTIEGKLVRTWEANSGRPGLSLEHPELVWGIAFSADGRTIATADKTAIKLWDAGTGKLRTTLKGHTGEHRDLRYTPDGKLLATTGADGVKLWDAQTNRLIRSLPAESATSGLSITTDGKLLATSRNGLRIWNAETGKPLHSLDPDGATTWGVAFGPNGRVLATAHDDKTVRLWDTATGKVLRKLEGNTDRVNRVAFSPDGRWVASAGKDPVVRRWRVSTVLSRPVAVVMKD